MRKTKLKKGLSPVIVLLLAGILFSVFLSGCLKTEPESETIKIVTSLPTGGTKIAQSILNGIELALEETDYAVNGHNIELIVEDGGDENGIWHKNIEEDIANRAAADEDVMIYLGPYNSGAAKVSIPITNKAGLAHISATNTWPGLTQPGFLSGEPGIFYPTGIRNYFRVVPTDALQGPVGAIWAKELGSKNVYIFDDGDDYGIGIANLFGTIAEEIGLNIFGRETVAETPQDIINQLTQLKNQDIDLIYFGGLTVSGAVPLAKGIFETDLGVMFMAPDGIMEQDFIDQAGNAAEGAYVTTVGVPPKELIKLTEKSREFYDNYYAKYKMEPETFSAFGYEAMKVALLAIERASTKDRTQILEEVSKIENYDGLFGVWSFDHNGDTTLTIISGSRVQKGNFVFEKLETGNVYEIISQIRSLTEGVKQ